MAAAHLTSIPTQAEATSWTPGQIVELAQAHAAVKHQLAWFKRQLFGQKSEKRLVEANPAQMCLGELPIPEAVPPDPAKAIAAHTRRARRIDCAADGDTPELFFDASRVPVETINVANPEIVGLTPAQYEVIGEKVSHRLAQRPGSYVVLKYVRPVIKRRDSETIHCPPAPVGVIEGSRADVSFIAGLLLDKFAWHLPLYRQHQRLNDAGLRVSRGWLTQLAGQAAALLDPIYEAQLASIRRSRIKTMDETPIKAGRSGTGTMKGGYFWPVYGERHEVCFPFFGSRAHGQVEKVLGGTQVEGSVLLSDGYSAYAAYTEQTGVTHAQCWTHCRREFVNAASVDPARAAEALDQIGALYAVEAAIQAKQLSGQAKRDYRHTHAGPLVDAFFAWVQRLLEEQGLLPSSPLTKALAYAWKRRDALQVFLGDPDVPIDTNHLERALRPIPMGKNYPRSTIRQGSLPRAATCAAGRVLGFA